MTNKEDGQDKLTKVPVDYWEQRWKDGKIGWHEKEVHKDLVKVQEIMLDKPRCRVFFPLCGKAVDMAHVARLGHRVVGLEFSEQAITEFFAETGVGYERRRVDAVHEVFVSAEPDRLDITIVRCDFFSFDAAVVFGADRKFDAIWDRGSLIAVNPRDRHRYRDVIMSLVSARTKYFVQGVRYDQSQHAGPPFSLPLRDVQALFGEFFHVEVRDECESPQSGRVYGVGGWCDVKYTLRPKNLSASTSGGKL